MLLQSNFTALKFLGHDREFHKRPKVVLLNTNVGWKIFQQKGNSGTL